MKNQDSALSGASVRGRCTTLSLLIFVKLNYPLLLSLIEKFPHNRFEHNQERAFVSIDLRLLFRNSLDQSID